MPFIKFGELWVDAGRPKRAHEPSHAGKAADRRSEIIGLAVVPTEPQMARRPVEQGKVRWDGGVIDDRAGTVSALKYAPHGGVEHRPVPRGALLPDDRRRRRKGASCTHHTATDG